MSRFNVLVTDTISEEGIDRLVRDGSIEVDLRPGIGSDELAGIIGDYDAIITQGLWGFRPDGRI